MLGDGLTLVMQLMEGFQLKSSQTFKLELRKHGYNFLFASPITRQLIDISAQTPVPRPNFVI